MKRGVTCDLLNRVECDRIKIKRTKIIADSTVVTITLPSVDGTVALTSQIPSLSNYVDLTSNQTIAGTKTFSSTPVISTISNIGTLTLPTSSGTVALTSQIPTSANYVDLTSNQVIAGIKTFALASLSSPTYPTKLTTIVASDMNYNLQIGLPNNYTHDVVGENFILQSATQNIFNKTIVSPIITTKVVAGYAPIVFSNTWEAFGDSITAGAGVANNQTWGYIVNLALGKTLVNNAVSGYFTHDTCSRVYNLHTTDRTVVIFIGTNDLRKQYEQYVTQALDRILDQCLACVLSATLWSCLPFANKINLRISSTLTGVWSNTAPYPIGIGTSATNATCTVLVTGRYVVVTITGTNNLGALYTSEKFNLTISNYKLDGDGTNGTYSANNLSVGHDMIAGVTSNWSQRSWIYDTGIMANHTVVVTYTGLPGNDNLYVDFIAGWTFPAANNTILVGIPNWNYRLDYLADTAALYATDTRRLTYNKGLMNLARFLRVNYNLPVYYVDNESNTSGGIQADSLHPNFSGHALIASRVLSVINNGEYNYLAA